MMNGSRLSLDLTEREIEILRLIADGLSNTEIAQKLFLALGTVKWYNTQIFEKLGVKNRAQAINRMRELALLDGAAPASSPAAGPPLEQPTPFIGRETELSELTRLLTEPACRLVTLVGPGGIGKTSLAIEAARRQTAAFADGVHLVSLSPLTSPDDMLPVLAEAVGFQFSEGDSLRQQLLAHLRGRRLLLVMDNFDELLAGADLLAELLQAAPRLKILATSRERLSLQQEVVFRVEGMPLPAADEAEIAGSDALQLFAQSAQRARPDFQLNAANRADVVRICHLVEGLPLGIVLAAAWVGMLTPAEIAAEIANGLDFLETETRNMPLRHRSIRGVFESTWNLLSDAERRAFARLSVFRGGFMREAAQHVTGEGLRTLLALTNKSLLRREASGRFGIHELLRQYAADQLADEDETTRQAHSDYYLDLLARGDTGSEAFDRIDDDFENIRAAWGWAVERRQSERIEQALHSLYAFCNRRSRFQDAEKLFDRVLALAAEQEGDFLEPAVWLQLRECRGIVRGLIGDLEGSVADLSAVRQAAHAAGDAARERSLLIHLGQLYRKSGRSAEAIQHLSGVLKFARASGDRRSAADALYHLGTVAWDEGDNTRAAAYHQEAVDLCRKLALRDVVGVQASHGMGEALLMVGQPERAAASFQESLELSQAIGDRGYEAENLQMIGWTALGAIGTADYRRSSDHFSRSLAISEGARLEWHTVCSQIGLGLAQAAAGDYQQGFDRIRRGYDLAETLGNVRFMSMALDSMGQVYQDLNLYSLAEDVHAQGRDLMLRSESTFWLPRLQANHAIDRLHQGDLSGAADLHTALEIALQRDQGMHAARCLEGLAELYLARGELERALVSADRLQELGQAGGLREMVAQAHRWRGEALLAAGRWIEAQGELKQAGTLAAEIGRVRLIWDIHAALARVYVTLGQDEAGRLHQDAVREIIMRVRQNLQDASLRASLPITES